MGCGEQGNARVEQEAARRYRQGNQAAEGATEGPGCDNGKGQRGAHELLGLALVEQGLMRLRCQCNMGVLLWGGRFWPSLAFEDAAEVASANGLLGFCRAQLGWIQAGERHSDFLWRG